MPRTIKIALTVLLGMTFVALSSTGASAAMMCYGYLKGK
jgi:hypothetical protein